MSHQETERDYAAMTTEEIIKSVIRDAKIQGTVTIPLRRDGYHTCCNLQLVEEL